MTWYIVHYYNVYKACSFFSFHTTWSHSNKAVQQAVPLIATHINELKLKIKIQCRKGFNNVNISNGLFFSERCVQTNFHNVLTRVIQFVCTQCRSYKTTSFEKEQSIAYIYILKTFPTLHYFLKSLLMSYRLCVWQLMEQPVEQPCNCVERKERTRCLNILILKIYIIYQF